MESHSSIITAGTRTFHHEFGAAECREIFKSKFLNYPYKPSLRIAVTRGMTKGNLDVAGSVTTKRGRCEYGTYVDQGKDYEYVVVSHDFDLFVSAAEMTYDFERKAILYRGVSFNAHNEDGAYDSELGTVVWNSQDFRECGEKTIEVLYTGLGQEVYYHNREKSAKSRVITVKQNPYLFSLVLQEGTYICGEAVFKTDQQNIYISISQTGQHKFPPTNNPVKKE